MPFSSFVSEQQNALKGNQLTLKQTSEVRGWFNTPVGELMPNSQEPPLNIKYHYDRAKPFVMWN